MILICPIRAGDKNEELRFALRSWETNLLLPDLRLVTVGYKPTWLQPDQHLEGNNYPSVPHAVLDNVKIVSSALEWVDEAIYMNDDFFCLDPQTEVLPVKRNQTLAQHLAIFSPGSSNWWPKSLALTALWLAEAGYPDPDSFEVHRPLLASPGAMIRALERLPFDPDQMVAQWRTVYGTLAEVDAYPVTDVKLGGSHKGMGSAWVSTNGQTFGRVAPLFKQRFQKPSRWEKA